MMGLSKEVIVKLADNKVLSFEGFNGSHAKEAHTLAVYLWCAPPSHPLEALVTPLAGKTRSTASISAVSLPIPRRRRQGLQLASSSNRCGPKSIRRRRTSCSVSPSTRTPCRSLTFLLCPLQHAQSGHYQN